MPLWALALAFFEFKKIARAKQNKSAANSLIHFSSESFQIFFLTERKSVHRKAKHDPCPGKP